MVIIFIKYFIFYFHDLISPIDVFFHLYSIIVISNNNSHKIIISMDLLSMLLQLTMKADAIYSNN
jgi:hypothetical protein